MKPFDEIETQLVDNFKKKNEAKAEYLRLEKEFHESRDELFAWLPTQIDDNDVEKSIENLCNKFNIDFDSTWKTVKPMIDAGRLQNFYRGFLNMILSVLLMDKTDLLELPFYKQEVINEN